MVHLNLRVRVAWWVKPYLRGVSLCSWLTGLEPDMAKVGRTIKRGVRFDTME